MMAYSGNDSQRRFDRSEDQNPHFHRQGSHQIPGSYDSLGEQQSQDDLEALGGQQRQDDLEALGWQQRQDDLEAYEGQQREDDLEALEGQRQPYLNSHRPILPGQSTRSSLPLLPLGPSISPPKSPGQLASHAYSLPPPPGVFRLPPGPMRWGDVYQPIAPLPLMSSAPVMYTSVDPFRVSNKTALPVTRDDKLNNQYSGNEETGYVVYSYTHRGTVLLSLLANLLNSTYRFFNSLTRQAYLLFLLHLPSFYFSRVARIFEEAKMTMPEIELMAMNPDPIIPLVTTHGYHAGTYPATASAGPAGAKLKITWEAFIDSLLREWKTLNIVSVLLLSAILTILQIEAAGADPIARNCALASLVCALMSLLYGCIYIIRFSIMRRTYQALEWAKMAQKTTTIIWWNVWVLLALPATWLAWSIIFYIACIMAFVWRSGANGLEVRLVLSARAALAIRITISAILGLGVLYFILILNTLRQYGDSMDKSFKRQLELFSKANWSSLPAKAVDLRFQARLDNPMPGHLTERNITQKEWEKFVSEAYNAWNGLTTGIFSPNKAAHNRMRPQDNIARLLKQWNRKYFLPRSTLAILCHEYIDLFPDSPAFAIYIIEATPNHGQPISMTERFGPVPEGLSRIDIFNPPEPKSNRKILGRTSIVPPRDPAASKVRFEDSETMQPIQPTETAYYGRPSYSRSPIASYSQNGVMDESGIFTSPNQHRLEEYRSPSESPTRHAIPSDDNHPGPSSDTEFNPAYTSPSSNNAHSDMVPPLPSRIPSYILEGNVPSEENDDSGGMGVPSGWDAPYTPGQDLPNTHTEHDLTASRKGEGEGRLQKSTSLGSPGPSRRRPTTASPIRSNSGGSSTWAPPPAVSSNSLRTARAESGPLTHGTYQTLTTAAILATIKALNDLLNPSEILNSSNQQIVPAQAQDSMTHSRTRDFRPQAQETLNSRSNGEASSLAGPVLLAPSDPIVDEPTGAFGASSTRRRSSSTSYKSLSQSPPRESASPSSPRQPSLRLPDTGHLSDSPPEEGRQLSGISSSTARSRGRDPTPRAEPPHPHVVHRQRITMTPTGSSSRSSSASRFTPSPWGSQQTDAVIDGPWTIYQRSLRTIFDTT